MKGNARMTEKERLRRQWWELLAAGGTGAVAAQMGKEMMT